MEAVQPAVPSFPILNNFKLSAGNNTFQTNSPLPSTTPLTAVATNGVESCPLLTSQLQFKSSSLTAINGTNVPDNLFSVPISDGAALFSIGSGSSVKAKKRVLRKDQFEQASSEAILSPIISRKRSSIAGPGAMMDSSVGLKKLKKATDIEITHINDLAAIGESQSRQSL